MQRAASDVVSDQNSIRNILKYFFLKFLNEILDQAKIVRLTAMFIDVKLLKTESV